MSVKRVLEVPYLSQTDNTYHPYGTCNITALAMCLQFFGIVGDGTTKQLEDQLWLQAQKRGLDVTYPSTLKTLADWKGLRDEFTTRGSYNTIVNAIDAGYPLIAHGYFTRVGHIVVVVGYEKADGGSIIYNDPYGEWFNTGYDVNNSSNSVKGKQNKMSLERWQSIVSPEGKDYGWYHIIKPRGK